MKFIPAKCPNCNGPLKLDPSGKSGFCSYCNTEILVKDSESKHKSASEKLLKLIEHAIGSNNKDKAYQYCEKILEMDPESSYFWALKLKAMLKFSEPYDFDIDEIIATGKNIARFSKSIEIKKRVASDFFRFAYGRIDYAIRLLNDTAYIKAIYDSSMDIFNKTNVALNHDIETLLNAEVLMQSGLTMVSAASGLEDDAIVNKHKSQIAKKYLTAYNCLASRVKTYDCKADDITFNLSDYRYHTAIRSWKSHERVLMLREFLKDVPQACNDLELQSRICKMSSSCFIATAVYGSPCSSEVIRLRQFRDIYLRRNFFGRWFIFLYYKYGPYLADHIKNALIIKNLIKKVLNIFINSLC